MEERAPVQVGGPDTTPAVPDEKPVMEGWLAKRRMGGKAMLAKWQRRYFQLTRDGRLTYASNAGKLHLQKDVYGTATSFNTQELRWLTRSDETTLVMEFPQRVLKLSADSVREAEKWHAALHNAMGGLSSPARQPVASLVAGVREAGSPVEGRASPQQGADHRKPQRDQHLVSQFNAESSEDDGAGDDSSEDGVVPVPADPPVPPPVLAQMRNNQSLTRGLELQLDPPDAAPKERPPSPRSLLANPRSGIAMIASPRREPVMDRPMPGGWAHVPADHDAGFGAPQHPGGRAPLRDRLQDAEELATTSPGLTARSPLAASPASVKRRALQPDLALPTTAGPPRPTLMHAISQRARGRDEERLELSQDGGGGEGGRPVSRDSDDDDAGAPLQPGHRLGRAASARGPPPGPDTTEVLVLNGPGAPPGGPAYSRSASLHSSLQSSLGNSARTSAPRLLSGAASRAPLQLDERIELPPPNYPVHPPGSTQRPPAAAGQAAVRAGGAAASPRSPGGRAGQDWDNWDSEESPAGGGGGGLAASPAAGRHGGNGTPYGGPFPPQPQPQPSQAPRGGVRPPPGVLRAQPPAQQQATEVRQAQQPSGQDWDNWDSDE